MSVRFNCEDCRSGQRGGAGLGSDALPCLACGEPVCPLDAVSVGTRIGVYRVERGIGRGGMASVYLAHDPGGLPVALKLFDRREGSGAHDVRLFLNEIRLHARLDHPHLVRAYGAGQSGGRLYLAMEFVPGGTLHGRVTGSGALSETETLDLGAKLGTALRYVSEEHGLVHCDVKPANVLFDDRGEPRLADLGLARMHRDVFVPRQQGAAIGTLNYASPEQAGGGDVDARSDIYSLGAALYTVITARVPFDAPGIRETREQYRQEGIEDPRRVNPGLSLGVVRLLQRMLAIRPAHRFGTWAEALAAMEATRAGQVLAPTPGGSMLKVGL